MNLPNKLTISRIIMSIIIIILLLFPFQMAGFDFPKLFINEKLVVDSKYLIAGVLFIIASLTDFLDGYIARKNNLVTDFGKLLDAIADKVLVNSVLIILASQGFIHPIIPVVCLMVGISLILFYNLPFELFNLRVADFLLFVAAIMSIISGIQYYNKNKHLIFED